MSLIKYKKQFVAFCFEEGYNIEAIRRDKSVQVYKCTPSEVLKYHVPFIISNPNSVEIRQSVIGRQAV